MTTIFDAYPVLGSILYGLRDGIGSGKGNGLIERFWYKAAKSGAPSPYVVVVLWLELWWLDECCYGLPQNFGDHTSWWQSSIVKIPACPSISTISSKTYIVTILWQLWKPQHHSPTSHTQVGRVVLSLAELHSLPSNIQSHDIESILHKEVDILLVKGKLRVKGAITRVEWKWFVHL